MIRPWFRENKHLAASLIVLPILLLLNFGPRAAYGQQPAKPEAAASEKPPGQEFALRGQRAARERSSIRTGAKPVSELPERTWYAGHRIAGNIRDRPIRCPHRPDRTRGRHGGAVTIVASRRPVPAGRRQDHDRRRDRLRIPYVWRLANTCVAGPIWPIPGC